MRARQLRFAFVDAIPEALADGWIYISVEFATAVHKCCCGCGNEVVTPLSPTDWKLTFDGDSVSLAPSIGNWSFPCRSHYWIVRNGVKWADQWSPDQIEAGRAADRRAKRHDHTPPWQQTTPPAGVAPQGLFSRLWRWLSETFG